MERVGADELEDYRQIFVERSHLLDTDTFNHFVEVAEQTKQPLEPVLIEKAFISPSQFLQLSADYYQLPSKMLSLSDVDINVLKYLKADDAQDLLAVPVSLKDGALEVAIAHPREADAVTKLLSSGVDVQLVITTEEAIRRALTLYDPSIQEVLKTFAAAASTKGASLPTEELATSIVESAVMLGASDIHVEPFEDTIVIRHRIDGLLKEVATLPPSLYKALVAYFKVSAGLKIDQTRAPQDGRLAMSVKGQELNLRLSLVPSLWGEKMVMRVLSKEAHLLDLNSLGLLESDIEVVRRNVRRPFGMVLVSGPTGSGKTTSLYAFLQEIGMDKINVVNISTIEDPIEYTIPRVTQIQTHPEIELTFANGLRALLRQDPDIIMVGEIRDEETADIAVRAALVGRLLFSSIHTNNAVGVIPRLLDMGVEPYLISSTLAMVVAQRLARKLCTYCRQSYTVTDAVLKQLSSVHDLKQSLTSLKKRGIVSSTNPSDLRFFKAVGCDKCNHTGYSGRSGLYEILEITDELRKHIGQQTDTATLRDIAIKGGMKTMFDDGLAKVTLGIIDLNELLRVVYD